MKMYQVQWRLCRGYDWEVVDKIFKDENDARLYASTTLLQFMTEAEIGGNLIILSLEVMTMPYWTSLNPYVASFNQDFFCQVKKMATEAMFENKLIFVHNQYGTEICFWDAGDLERAKVLAQSMYDGWRFARGNQSEETV